MFIEGIHINLSQVGKKKESEKRNPMLSGERLDTKDFDFDLNISCLVGDNSINFEDNTVQCLNVIGDSMKSRHNTGFGSTTKVRES